MFIRSYKAIFLAPGLTGLDFSARFLVRSILLSRTKGYLMKVTRYGTDAEPGRW